MWNLNNGNLLGTFYGHDGIVNKAKFTPNKKVASISEDGTLKIWKFGQTSPELDIKSTKEKGFHTNAIVDFSFHQEKQLVVTIGMDKTFCLANFVSGDVYHKSNEIGDLQTVEMST